MKRTRNAEREDGYCSEEAQGINSRTNVGARSMNRPLRGRLRNDNLFCADGSFFAQGFEG